MGPEHESPVDAFRQGDERALADLYARWSPLVYSYALRSLDDVTRAEEATRETFTRAWLARDSFDPDRTRFPTWLLALTQQVLGTDAAGVGTRGRPSVTNEDNLAGSESRTGVLAEQMLVADAVSHLDPSSRGVLRMALEHHLTLVEIAARTGLRVDEVLSQVTGSLNELRERLEVRTDAR